MRDWRPALSPHKSLPSHGKRRFVGSDHFLLTYANSLRMSVFVSLAFVPCVGMLMFTMIVFVFVFVLRFSCVLMLVSMTVLVVVTMRVAVIM